MPATLVSAGWPAQSPAAVQALSVHDEAGPLRGYRGLTSDSRPALSV